MLTKSFVVIAGIVVVILAVGGSWAVDALTASPSSSRVAASTPTPGPAGASGKQGVAGETGADGTNGTNGADGTNGSNGATGKAGANGTDGTDGANGTDGAAGPPGPSGGSAPTFSASAAAGTLQGGFEFEFPAITADVPAGPALVGFSLNLNSSIPIPVTCSIVNANDNSIVYGSTTPASPASAPTVTTYAANHVVTIDTATPLTVVCNQAAPFPGTYTYKDLSIYAVSFT